jgi:putative transposase
MSESKKSSNFFNWHQTLKNCSSLENFYLPGELKAKIDAFVGHYNGRLYHESLGNLIG